MTSLTVERHPFWEIMNGGRPYEPMPWQNLHIHARSNYKRLVIAAGRRSGKSFAVQAEIVKEVTKPPETVMGVEHFPIVYIAGPTAELANRIFEPIWNLFVPSESGTYVPPLGFLHKAHEKNRGLIELATGARIYRKSGDDPRSMQGERVTMFVPDEAQDMPEDAWQNVMPALADSGGRMIAIGIPRGKGRFRSYYFRGQGVDSLFYSATVPSTVNPQIARVAAEAGYEDVDLYIREVLASDLTEIELRQQYYAEWVDEGGSVFHDFEDYFDAKRPVWAKDEDGNEVRPRGTYIMGLDVGKKRDYMSAHVIEVGTQTFVDKDRFNGIDYTVAGPRLTNLYKRWGCKFIHMDSTGIGEGMADILRAEGCSLIPFNFTNESKARLVGRFASEIERGRVHFLKDDEVLKKEMALFEAKLSGTLIRYEAPAGFFDDSVISAALAVYKSAPNRNMARSPVNRPYVTFSKPSHRRRRLVAA